MTDHVAYWKIAADDGWDPSIVLFLFLMSRKDYPLKVTPGLYCWLSERLYGTARYQDQVEEGLDALLQRGRILRRGDEIRVNATYLDQVKWNAQQNDEARAAKKGWAPPKDFVSGSAKKKPSFLDDWRKRQREALEVVAPAPVAPAPVAPAKEKPRTTFLAFKTFITENADPKTRLFTMRAYDIAKELGINESSVNPWVRALCDLGHLELVSAYDNKTKRLAIYRVAEIADDFDDALGDE